MGQGVSVLEDSTGWRRLVREYASLRDLRAVTAQQRGQRFNGLIAELLGCFGMSAKADQRSIGEIDVTFSHGGRRFILEAKWESRPVGTDYIAKLQRRVEQRMLGVTGVFLSMSGYSENALAELDRGRRLDLLLLDRGHWEAMLSGFVPPAELFDLVTDAASFEGKAYKPVRELIGHRRDAPRVDFEATWGSAAGPVAHVLDRATVELVADGIPSRRSAVRVLGEHRLMVTVDDGVLDVDLARQRADWRVQAYGCYGSPVITGDSVVVQRGYGVGRFRNRELEALSSGSSSPSDHRSSVRVATTAWLLDWGGAASGHNVPELVQVGQQLGDEHVSEIPALPGVVSNACWLDSGDVVVTDGVDTCLYSTENATVHKTIAVPQSHPGTLVALGDRQVMSVGTDSGLWVADVVTGQRVRIGVLEGVDAAGARLAAGVDGSVYLSVGHRAGRGSDDRIAILRITVFGRWLEKDGPAAATRGIADTPAAEHPVVPDDPGPAPSVPSAPPAPPPVTDGPPTPTVASADTAERRVVDHRQGQSDGAVFAASLPLFVMESVIAAQFDPLRWLEPWREQWRLLAAGHAPPGSTLAAWQPQAAQYLGAYAAPDGLVDSHFAPSPAYTAGFAYGMRTTWNNAVQRQAVPRDPVLLHNWLRQPVRGGVRSCAARCR